MFITSCGWPEIQPVIQGEPAAVVWQIWHQTVIRDGRAGIVNGSVAIISQIQQTCLLYTSDAADE